VSGTLPLGPEMIGGGAGEAGNGVGVPPLAVEGERERDVNTIPNATHTSARKINPPAPPMRINRRCGVAMPGVVSGGISDINLLRCIPCVVFPQPRKAKESG
jgi:hypothetical protein